ncbi:permease [Endozoicomonas sp.]|uniref:permease n=1 Tax=Endozoicomonas sp. TaxID=1892382 RepID=UPI002884C041|nr:hypothetical protein [Endozoicomonas sp.]
MTKFFEAFKAAMPVLILLAITAASALLYTDQTVVTEGLTSGYEMGLEIIPTMLIAFIFSGLVMKLIPEAFLNRWLGKDAGLKGYLLALAGGMITPAGPAVIYPMIGMMIKKRCSVGIITTFLSSWGMLGLIRAVAWGVPLLGAKLMLLTLLVSLPAPLIAGWLVNVIYEKYGLSMDPDPKKIDTAIIKIQAEEH